MRISDWSSDVCSSDLRVFLHAGGSSRACSPTIRSLQPALRDSPDGYDASAVDYLLQGSDEHAHAGTRESHAVRATGRLLKPSCQHNSVDLLDSSLHDQRSEEHTSELQSLMRISYAVFCLKK